MLTICVPVLNCYELLKNLIISAENGSLVPDRYCIYDNGNVFDYNIYPKELQSKIDVFSPMINRGVAKAWNYFLRNVPEVRIISNDDLEFGYNAIKNLVDNKGHGVTCSRAEDRLNAFSLFLIDDWLVKEIGYFDESLSPNYAYYEDNDYVYRMKLKGYELYPVPCETRHVGSATVRKFSPFDIELHHKKFRFAQSNYLKKWGGLPTEETFMEPHNGERK